MALKLKKTTRIQKVVKKIVPTTGTSVRAVQKAQLSYASGEYIEGVGRRKVATARVRIYQSKGDFIVNDSVVGAYFSGVRNADRKYLLPFKLTGTEKQFAVTARVSGSGTASQLDAVVLAISRALVEFNAEFRPLLKKAGLMTRDDRMKETRKIGMGGKARRARQSPKR
ncbi:30S ribosomal protein S9 [Candidatus Woesebacteria bacterium]|nr:30S ribosomal protein S9 [Candidatus Woesebacteria bacterium]